jgi:hypothetical protein
MKRFNLEAGVEKRGGEIVLPTPEDALAIVRIQAASWLATYPNEQYGITSEDIEAKKLDSLVRFSQWKKTIEESGADHQVWVAGGGLLWGIALQVEERKRMRLMLCTCYLKRKGEESARSLWKRR